MPTALLLKDRPQAANDAAFRGRVKFRVPTRAHDRGSF